MSRKINLPLDSAKGMVGPDCAYHLYSQFNTGNKDAHQESGDSKDQDDT